MTGWKHGEPYSLPIKPSPNLPNDQSIRLYASLCPFEATHISVGRGTTFPFQVLGAPNKKYGSFVFTPRSLPGFDKNPLHQGIACYGEDLRNNANISGFTLTTSYVFIKYQVKGPDSFPDPDGLIYLWEPTRCAKLFSEENLKKLFEIVGKKNYRLIGRRERSICFIDSLLAFFSSTIANY